VKLLGKGLKIIRHLVLLATMLVLASACSGEKAADNQAEEKSPETTFTGVADGPEVSVSADKTHAVQPGDEITLTVTVNKFTLDASKIGTPNEANVGHYRVYLDDASGDNFLADSGADTVKVKVPDAITDGSHQLRVVLHNNDRSPVTPAAQADVWLIVYRL
jgi:hypothetical protein